MDSHSQALAFEAPSTASSSKKLPSASSPYARYPLRESSSSSNWSSTDDSHGSAWDLQMDCDDMTPMSEYRSLEEVCERTKARMSAAARMGLPASCSSSGYSVSSSVSASSFETTCEDESELSRSFESNGSFFPTTPARTSHPSSSSFHRSSSSTTTSPEHFSPLSNLRLDDGEKRRGSIGYSPRSGLRSMINSTTTTSADRQGTPMPDSPQSSRASLGQSLGLPMRPKATSSAPIHGSPLTGKKDLPLISENGTLDASSSTFRPPASSNLAARRKLPPLAIRGTRSDGTSAMPQTPGGSVFIYARDGAANGGQTPVSPFQPPTPLVAAVNQPHRGSLPHIYSGLPTASSSSLGLPMQRNGSLGLMSPLSRDFANVSVASTSQDAVSPGSQVSADSLETAMTTPPFSPLGLSKPLTPTDGDHQALASTSRQSSGESAEGEARGKKRSKDGGLGLRINDGSIGATRPKLLKSKSSNRVVPYPSGPAKPSPSPSQSASASTTSSQQPSPLLGVSNLQATSMTKSLSAPPQPTKAELKTVSAKHLSTRPLHPTFAANYTLADELGSGGFGFVVSATRNCDGLPVAVKFIWKDKVPSHGWVRDPTLGVIPLEAFVLRVVDHPCVVKFHELFDDDEFFYLVMEMHGTPWKAPDGDDGKTAAAAAAAAPKDTTTASTATAPSPKLAIYAPDSSEPVLSTSPSSDVAIPSSQESSTSNASNGSATSLKVPPRPAPMERRTSHDLFECIEQHSRFPEDRAAWVFAQIVEAVYYLDKLGICHRDIKDENCVIDADWNVKLIDFGSAVISDPRKPAPYFNRFFGTMTFASAEILHGQQYRAPHAEVWSLGVLLSILLSGECPFSDPSAAKKGRISSRVRSSWSPAALDLLSGCVQVDPDRRATIDQVREHPWVKEAWAARGMKRPSAPPKIF